MLKLMTGILDIFSNHISKSPVLKGLDSLFIGLHEQFGNKPISLDDLAQKLDKDTDSKIIELQHLEQLSFFAGELIVQPDPQNIKNFSLHLKLYFYSTEKKIILKEFIKNLPLSLLTQEAKNEIDGKKAIKYNINPPV